MMTPPKKVIKPCARWLASWPFRARPICKQNSANGFNGAKHKIAEGIDGGKRVVGGKGGHCHGKGKGSRGGSDQIDAFDFALAGIVLIGRIIGFFLVHCEGSTRQQMSPKNRISKDAIFLSKRVYTVQLQLASIQQN